MQFPCTNPQAALKKAYKVNNQSNRIIGVDLENKEVVIFQRTGKSEVYHGYKVKSFKELGSDQMNLNVLRKNGLLKIVEKFLK